MSWKSHLRCVLTTASLGLVIGAQPCLGQEAPELLPPLAPGAAEPLPAPANPAPRNSLPTPTPNNRTPDSAIPNLESLVPPAPDNRLPPIPESASQLLAPKPLSLDEVRKLAKVGLHDKIIARVIRERGVEGPLTATDLIWLRQSGVSNELIVEVQRTYSQEQVFSRLSTHAGRTYDPLAAPMYLRPAPPYPSSHRLRPPHRYHRRIPLRRSKAGFSIAF